MFLFFGLITYHLRWITYISSKWLHTATSCGLNYVLRHIAIFRWTVAKPMGNEQSEAIGALRRKIPSSGPKNKALLRKGFIFIQSEGLVCNRRQAYVIRLPCKRYVIKSQDLYVPFLLIDYIPPTVDYIHFFEMITYKASPWFNYKKTENRPLYCFLSFTIKGLWKLWV